MGKKKSKLEVVGKTVDGRFVVKGAFLFVGTYGVPLNYVLSSFIEENFTIDWVDFYESALRDGWVIKMEKEKIQLSFYFDVFPWTKESDVIYAYSQRDSLGTKTEGVTRYRIDVAIPDPAKPDEIIRVEANEVMD